MKVNVDEPDRRHRADTAKVETFQGSLPSGGALLDSGIMKAGRNRVFARIATEDARCRDFSQPG